jgi:hypothetical protein
VKVHFQEAFNYLGWQSDEYPTYDIESSVAAPQQLGLLAGLMAPQEAMKFWWD